jgi:hypothetical protein
VWLKSLLLVVNIDFAGVQERILLAVTLMTSGLMAESLQSWDPLLCIRIVLVLVGKPVMWKASQAWAFSAMIRSWSWIPVISITNHKHHLSYHGSRILVSLTPWTALVL